MSVEETIKKITDQSLEKERQLQRVLQIIKSKNCIRESVLEFFGEEVAVTRPISCCSVCGSYDDEWIFDINTSKTTRKLLDWSERLTKLLG